MWIVPTSVRLDSKTEALLNRLALARGQSKSRLIREAIARLAEGEAGLEPKTGPYALVADLIGIAHGGPPGLARRTSEAFRELLLARRKAR